MSKSLIGKGEHYTISWAVTRFHQWCEFLGPLMYLVSTTTFKNLGVS